MKYGKWKRYKDSLPVGLYQIQFISESEVFAEKTASVKLDQDFRDFNKGRIYKCRKELSYEEVAERAKPSDLKYLAKNAKDPEQYRLAIAAMVKCLNRTANKFYIEKMVSTKIG